MILVMILKNSKNSRTMNEYKKNIYGRLTGKAI